MQKERKLTEKRKKRQAPNNRLKQKSQIDKISEEVEAKNRTKNEKYVKKQNRSEQNLELIDKQTITILFKKYNRKKLMKAKNYFQYLKI